MAERRPGRGGERRKGTFGEARLPVAGQYVIPPRRRWPWIAGALAAVAAVAWAVLDFSFRRAAFVSSGPLSSPHAVLERDCASCHGAFDEVRDQSCAVCHEKAGDEIGVYSFAAHYLYRTQDFQRVVPSADELACASCHPEHLGRDAAIVRVDDRRCATCHEFGSFADGHPEFAFVAEDAADAAGLVFPHVRHVREIMDRYALEDVERACLACHLPESDGRGFQAIDFDRSCDACHLTTAVRTPRLPIRRPGASEPGVETLAEIRRRGGPGTLWADFTSPSEFQELGERVTKTVIHHEDPWVLANLRTLRSELFADTGLADLLKASPDVPPHRLPALYREAIATLEDYATGLRARPEAAVQDELRRIDALLRELEQALDEPYTPLDESKFLLALESRREGLVPARVAEIENLITDLTQPCRPCHEVRDATFVRVQTDQRVLRRAEFDHRAHVLELGCLDCHNRIPIADALTDPEGTDLSGDLAVVQNLPAIAACQACHQPALVASSCVTCHDFHPDKSRHADLLLSRDSEGGT